MWNDRSSGEFLQQDSQSYEPPTRITSTDLNASETAEAMPPNAPIPVDESPMTTASAKTILSPGNRHQRRGRRSRAPPSARSMTPLSPLEAAGPRSMSAPAPTTTHNRTHNLTGNGAFSLRSSAPGPRMMSPISSSHAIQLSPSRDEPPESAFVTRSQRSTYSVPPLPVYEPSPDDDWKHDDRTVATMASTIDTRSVATGPEYGDTRSVATGPEYGEYYYETATLAEEQSYTAAASSYSTTRHEEQSSSDQCHPRRIPRPNVSQEALTFGQFACDAIQTELQVKVVLVLATSIPNADHVYSMMQCEDPLDDPLSHKIQLVRVRIPEYDLRQLMQAACYDHTVPQLVATTEWEQRWEFVCEDDVDLVEVALPQSLLSMQELGDVPAIHAITRRLYQLDQFPRADDWIPGILLVLRHLCQIHDIQL